tara:strand:- start:824 stop:1129 length:306 start_codon:yes stop_codon:yes gene_type:complete
MSANDTINMKGVFKTGSPLSLRTIAIRTGLNRKQVRSFVREKMVSGEIRRVNPLEVGSGKFANSNERIARSKDEKKRQRKDRNGSFNRSWKKGGFNVFAPV